MSARRATIEVDFTSILSEISVDDYTFRVTPYPLNQDECVLWLKKAVTSSGFEPVGKFSGFNKRRIIEFIARYTTSAELRREVERKRFSAKVETLSPAFFAELSHMSPWQQRQAFDRLFNLDAVIEQPPLESKRRIMAKRFHPDAGGDTRAMSVINEAYDYVTQRSSRR
jgi:hypothetical protein